MQRRQRRSRSSSQPCKGNAVARWILGLALLVYALAMVAVQHQHLNSQSSVNDISTLLGSTKEAFLGVHYSILNSFNSTEDDDENKKPSRQGESPRPDNCIALKLHEGGHWEHHYYTELNDISQETTAFDSASIREQYLPLEIEWMKGKNWLDRWEKEECSLAEEEDVPLMYGSQLGNQCGSCGVTGFQPSYSTWIPANDTITIPEHNSTQTQPLQYNTVGSPGLRLMKRLTESNRTLCFVFVGDSIDLQFYHALRHNLVRQNSLQNEITISISSIEIPVNFSDVGLPKYQIFG